MDSPKPLQILIVEDEALLAMELESLIEEAGHSVAGWAPGVREAEALIDREHIDLAFIDVQLRDGGSGLEVARHLEHFPSINYVFLTANPKRLPKDLAGACGVISKPYSINGLLTCLEYLEQGIRRPPPVVAQPESFTLAPRLAGDWTTAG